MLLRVAKDVYLNTCSKMTYYAQNYLLNCFIVCLLSIVKDDFLSSHYQSSLIGGGGSHSEGVCSLKPLQHPDPPLGR